MPNISPKEVIERHRVRVIQIPGVVGLSVGLSKNKPDTRCILVYLTCDDWPAERERELDGFDVEIHKSSGFVAR